jgi:hypothetical protein
MLTFAMATGDEGLDLDLALQALAGVSGPGDRLLVFHAGDDRSFTRLQGFAAQRPTRIIRTDSPVDRPRDLLRLALEMAETDYTLLLSPTDRLQPEATARLRRRLAQEAPDLMLLHSAWWLTDTTHPLPRSDSARFEDLPLRPAPADCADLLPDPRRLVYRSADWLARLATWPPAPDDRAFFDRALAESTDFAVLRAPVLLHLFAPADPAPTLAAFTADLAERDRSERAACLTCWTPALEECLALCPPAGAVALLDRLPGIIALLPRTLRRDMANRPGAFARLLAARIDEGATGAKAELALQLADRQQQRSEILAAAYGRLRQDLDLALPGPDYLRALYTRLRDL